MSKEPRYAWIGTFVVGAIVIIAAAVLFLGRGKFFERTGTYIAFFSGSVKGLQIGAAVSFRGARVGTVKDVSIVYKADRDELIIPVLLELDADSVQGLTSIESKKGGPSEGQLISRLIDKGLKARLGLDSMTRIIRRYRRLRPLLRSYSKRLRKSPLTSLRGRPSGLWSDWIKCSRHLSCRALLVILTGCLRSSKR